MSIIKSARTNLKLSQFGMAAWLQKRIGRRINAKQVSDWECGRKQPRQDVRDAATTDAARALLKEIRNTPESNHEQLIMEMMK